MNYYFNTHGNANSNSIAIVTADVDVNSFRHDSNWYEMTEAEYQAMVKNAEHSQGFALKPVVKQTKKAINKADESQRLADASEE